MHWLIVQYNFILLLKFFQFWQLGTHSDGFWNTLINPYHGYFFFQVFPYFLVLKDAPGPSCIFLTPFLESDTSPKLPHLAPESGPWLWSRFHILDYSSPHWSHKELFLGSSSEESGEMSESKAQKSMKGLPKTATTQEFLTFMLLYPQPPVICKNNYLRFSS